jgi:hypothetical protein
MTQVVEHLPSNWKALFKAHPLGSQQGKKPAWQTQKYSNICCSMIYNGPKLSNIGSKLNKLLCTQIMKYCSIIKNYFRKKFFQKFICWP